MRLITSACFILLAFTTLVSAQRLPENAVPSHYDLSFTPDLKQATFEGEETIDLSLKQSSKSITLNSAEIEMHQVTITASGVTQTASVTYDEKKEQATLTVANEIPAGSAKVHITFHGILNDQLRGFYLSKSEKRNYAVTQFEATDARRAFPDFDEPAYKATFDITLVVDKGDIAISNGVQISDTPGPGDNKHTVKFKTSAKMSSYLVAMLVGDFQCISGTSEGIALRVCSTPEQVQKLGWALEGTKHFIQYFNNYYGIPYPYEKLDQIGIPDFAAGAMENTAAITYRETDLLVDPKTGSEDERKNVAGTISHEIAHQWFGDLVTMKWWDDIWLNEGFATWMSNKPLTDWKPQWNIALDEASDTGGALGLDSLGSTRPIHMAAETPAEINQLFDGIAYDKTGAVLRMLESYAGEKSFEDGIHSYLKKYSYTNTTAEDFWNEIAAVTHKPIDKVMSTFVYQAGAPLLTVSAKCDGQKTKVSISQDRFFLDPALMEKGSPELWQVPVGIKMPGKAGGEMHLLTQKQEDITINGCFPWVFVNAGARGYYRTQYDPALRSQIAPVFGAALRPAERIRFLNDEWALVNAGREKVGSFLDLAAGLKNETYDPVLDMFLARVNLLTDLHLRGEEKKQFAVWVRRFLQPYLKDLGMEKKPGETLQRSELRNEVLRTLANHEDAAVLEHYRTLSENYMKDPASVDPDQIDEALVFTARHGDAAMYDKFLAKMRATTGDQSQYYRYMRSLTRFEDPALVQKTLALGLSGEVRTQDLFRVFGGLFNNRAAQRDVWTYFKANFDTIQERTKGSLGDGQAGLTSSFCEMDLRNEAQKFFTEKAIPGGERSLKQALERIDSCVRFHDKHMPEMTTWLASKK